MAELRPVAIELSEEFPSLAHPPIVEAVIEIRARAAAGWTDEFLRREMAARLPEYPQQRTQRDVEMEMRIDVAGTTEQRHRDAWRGVRVTSSDQSQIVQFNRDGFVFSRVPPYCGWRAFREEALRVLVVYLEMAQPTEIERVGLRFINRILPDAPATSLRDLVREWPGPPKGLDLPVLGSLHRDVFQVTGQPYAVARVQAIETAPVGAADSPGLVLDIDVFTTEPCLPILADIERHAGSMHWLKNKVFFGSVSERALAIFQRTET